MLSVVPVAVRHVGHRSGALTANSWPATATAGSPISASSCTRRATELGYRTKPPVRLRRAQRRRTSSHSGPRIPGGRSGHPRMPAAGRTASTTACRQASARPDEAPRPRDRSHAGARLRRSRRRGRRRRDPARSRAEGERDRHGRRLLRQDQPEPEGELRDLHARRLDRRRAAGSYVVAPSPKFVLVGQADAKRNIKTVFQRTGTP